ncbi:MAG: response regulator [Acidimicrobiales bacterium]
MGIRLLLADDHRMVREGIKRGLVDHGFDVVGESTDGDEVVRMAKELTPDIVLLSTNLPGQTGVDACRQIHAAVPRTRLVMLAPHADVESFTNAMQAGANGYLVKANALSELATALRLCAAGETVIAPQMKSVMLGEAQRSRERATVGAPAGAGSKARGLITKREEEVLQLIADGCSTPEVASELYISQKTVKNHLASIYQKLDARDRTQAVLTAVRLGIVALN